MQLKKGTLLKNGQYTIVKTLGIGGFGITYLAMTNEQVRGKLGGFDVQVPVALKEFFVSDYCSRDVKTNAVVLPSTGSTDKVGLYKRKFIKEAHSMSQLHHDHIVQVSDVFEENNTVYYAMQYLEGGSLRDRVEAGGPLDEETAKRYVLQIADALSYMHNRHHLCHLDVKPGNIMLDASDKAVLIDFGIAKRYDAHGEESTVTPVGISRGYSPLEQYNGTLHDFSPQTDVYGLAATLFFLLTGQTPPDANTILEQKGIGPRPNTISPALWSVISKAMQPSRIDRVANMDEMKRLLAADENTHVVADDEYTRQLRTEEAVDCSKQASPTSALPKMRVRKLAVLLLALALAAVLFAVGKGCLSNQTSHSHQQELAHGRQRVAHYRWHDMLYDGTLLNGVPDGEGRAVYDDGRVYEGRFVNGKRIDPQAHFVYANKLVFRGRFDADTIRHGRVDTPAGDIYFLGDFSEGRPFNGFWYLTENNRRMLKVVNGKEQKH